MRMSDVSPRKDVVFAPAMLDVYEFLYEMKEHPGEWRSWTLFDREAYCLLRGLRKLRILGHENIDYITRRENDKEIMVMGRYDELDHPLI